VTATGKSSQLVTIDVVPHELPGTQHIVRPGLTIEPARDRFPQSAGPAHRRH